MINRAFREANDSPCWVTDPAIHYDPNAVDQEREVSGPNRFIGAPEPACINGNHKYRTSGRGGASPTEQAEGSITKSGGNIHPTTWKGRMGIHFFTNTQQSNALHYITRNMSCTDVQYTFHQSNTYLSAPEWPARIVVSGDVDMYLGVCNGMPSNIPLRKEKKKKGKIPRTKGTIWSHCYPRINPPAPRFCWAGKIISGPSSTEKRHNRISHIVNYGLTQTN